MKSLEQLLNDKGFNVTNLREDILDNEYLLRSNIKNKELKVQKNLQRLFYCDMLRESKLIKNIINKFMKEIN